MSDIPKAVRSADELFEEAFALLRRAEQLLLAARARHELAARERLEMLGIKPPEPRK